MTAVLRATISADEETVADLDTLEAMTVLNRVREVVYSRVAANKLMINQKVNENLDAFILEEMFTMAGVEADVVVRSFYIKFDRENVMKIHSLFPNCRVCNVKNAPQNIETNSIQVTQTKKVQQWTG